MVALVFVTYLKDNNMIYAVKTNWTIASHESDLGEVMNAEECRYVGNDEADCKEFIDKYAPFKMPTDEQIVNMAVMFNDGNVNMKKLRDMVAMCMFVIDRLYENGDIMIPSSKENSQNNDTKRPNI